MKLLQRIVYISFLLNIELTYGYPDSKLTLNQRGNMTSKQR